MSSPALLKPGRAATTMAFVRAIVQGYARHGIDPAEALRQAQIAPRDVARPGARVTAAQLEVLSAPLRAAQRGDQDRAAGQGT